MVFGVHVFLSVEYQTIGGKIKPAGAGFKKISGAQSVKNTDTNQCKEQVLRDDQMGEID